MILDDVITEARRLLQDETATFRYSDAFMLAIGNLTLRRMCVLRPDLFSVVAEVSCTQNEVLQSAPSDSLRIIEVFSVTAGGALAEVNRAVMDRNTPTWTTDTAAVATNWMRHIRNPNKFFIYPKAPAAQSVDVEYAQSPPIYDGTTAVALLPDAWFPVLVDGMVGLSESIDNEHITSGRAKIFLESFTEALGASLQGRSITDTETGGLAKEEVI